MVIEGGIVVENRDAPTPTLVIMGLCSRLPSELEPELGGAGFWKAA